ncbi:winged helix-turn-helix domain-containing protein [Ferrimonas balearica]|uniref:winged helix-turn-helix domain-containing protein n=1 Tax=Ferrimonas balearica TaxID=44012 RepID=UPI001C9982A2|nr:winged helix-turn-helix domain-containing protein [Ferrimonas balearica]MBY5921638.1 winged helix-turn-helix domain-containing protein [Ferrimonas balearica]MBY5995022.1 winged helix-turn-helix domain-containing protein [Ferrimonas balearica]
MEYRFDRFTLDLSHQRLTCDKTLLSSDPRLIRLLELLIKAAPEPVTPDTLLNELWPDTHVSHWSISRLISDARKLFKDAGADFSVIQTLHGRGYRFAVEAQRRLLPDDHHALRDEPKDTEKPVPADSGHSLSWPIRIVLLGQVVLIALLGWQLWSAPDPELRIGEPAHPVARILWVDDHPDNNLSERRALQRQRVAVYTTTSSHEAIMLLDLYHYDLIISDMGRAGDPLAGLKLVKTLRESGDDTPYLLYTIMPSDAMSEQALAHGAQSVAVDSSLLFQQVAKHIPLDPELAAKDNEGLNL